MLAGVDPLTRTVDNLQRAARLVEQAGLSQIDMEPVACSLLFELDDLELLLEDQVTLVALLQSTDHLVIGTGIPEHLRPEAYRFAGRRGLAHHLEQLKASIDVDDVARNDVQPGPGREEVDPTGLSALSSPGGQ